MPRQLQIKINGETREVYDGETIKNLLDDLGLQDDRVAVERNYEVVRRASWPVITLEENDQIEIIHFVGGGMRVLDRC